MLQGRFTVAAAQPVNYTVEETHDLFDIQNQVLASHAVARSLPWVSDPPLGVRCFDPVMTQWPQCHVLFRSLAASIVLS